MACYKELRSLEQKILLNSQALHGRKIIIMLGDYIDGASQSAPACGSPAGAAAARDSCRLPGGKP